MERDNAREFVDRLSAFDADAFLLKLPSRFVASLDLGLLADKYGLEYAPWFVQAMNGNQEAIDQVIAWGSSAEEIQKARDELLSIHKDAQLAMDALAILCALDPVLARNFLVMGKVAVEVERICIAFSKLGLPEETGERLLLGRLPQDILACQVAAREGVCSIGAVLTLSFAAPLRLESWATSEALSKSLQRLKDARSAMRKHMATNGGEYAAVANGPALVGDRHFPSAHHAVEFLIGETIDRVSLARKEDGRALFLSSIVAAGLKEDQAECVAVGCALLVGPVLEFRGLLAAGDQEASRAALARQAIKVNRAKDADALVTLEAFAKLVFCEKKTLQNKNYGALPAARIKRKGNQPHLYDYSELRSWAIARNVPNAERLPLESSPHKSV